jgi:ribosome biogenesis protein BMS1
VRNLVRHYSKRNIKDVTGPVTIVTGRKRRVTFLEVGPDLPSMMDAAKVADLVLLTIDASYGFEMETFEFLNIAAAHGMPKVIGVLTHIDGLKDGKQSRKAKKSFKDRFWAELYDGAKLFYFSGITTTGDYLKREVLNLARFISVSKFPVIRWRNEHPYVLADRVEDISGPNAGQLENRSIVAFGYVRGTPLRIAEGGWRVHVAGVGDLIADSVKIMPDPCPAPDTDVMAAPTGDSHDATSKDGTENKKKTKRRVGERERLIYAPMAPEVDGIAYDRDAIYIDIAKGDMRFSNVKSTKEALAPERHGVDETGSTENSSCDESSDGEGETMVKALQRTGVGIDERMKDAELQLVSGGKRFISEQFENGRRRRRVIFDGEPGDIQNDDSESVGLSDSEESDDHRADDSDEEDDIQIGSSSDRGTETCDVDSDEDASRTNGSNDISDDVDESSKSNDGTDSFTSSERTGRVSKALEEVVTAEGQNGKPSIAMRWKSNMLETAAKRIRSQFSSSKSLAKYIYGGGDPIGDGNKNGSDPRLSDDDDFFSLRNRAGVSRSLSDAASISAEISSTFQDVTRLLPDSVHDWMDDLEACAHLRRLRFGTGQGDSDGSEEGDDHQLLDDPAMPVDGDFEDLETGELHVGSARAARGDENDDNFSHDDDLDAIREKKLQKKATFDAEWDEVKVKRIGHGRRKAGNASSSDEDVPCARNDQDHESQGDDETSKGRGDPASRPKSRQAERSSIARAPDERQLERARLASLRAKELGELDLDARVALEGILPGCYVRMEVKNVPVEFVKYFDPKKPVVIGGLKHADDEGMSFVRARIRRHRFKRGVLKSSDPVVFSIGWRRIQSVPIYDVEDQGGRRRFLKYTPEYLHCNATFWAPTVSPGSGVILCQSLGRERSGFRIAGSGVVTEVDASFKIVKKLKLVGEPYKVHHNTAFIKGMFNSELEVSKFVGAGIRTVSGIRGSIKKAVSERAAKDGKHKERTMGRSPAGAFRAGFEDKVLLSDIVFLRAWVPVEPPRFCTVASNLLDDVRSGGVDGSWRMRTVRELREERQLPIPRNADSLYGEVERKAPLFGPLRIPKKVESGLPFASKPKNFAPAPKLKESAKSERKKVLSAERAVVMEPGERREAALVHAIYNIRKDRLAKRRDASARRLAVRKAEAAREDAKHAVSTAERKKRKYAIDGAAAARKTKRARGGAGDDED